MLTAILQKMENSVIARRRLRRITSLFPRRIKRLVFIGFMLKYLRGNKNPDLDLLKELNKTFNVASDARAMQLPLIFKDVIWQDFNLKGIDIQFDVIDGKRYLTPVSKVNICYYISGHIPKWIRYASTERIYTDVMMLINYTENDKDFILSSTSY